MTSDALTLGELADLLTKTEARLAGVHDTADVLVELVATARDHLPGADHAGITHLRRGRFATIGATDELVRRVDQVQYDMSSGPCVDAVVDDTVLVTDDLAHEPRWPEFGARAVAMGIHSMLSVRMFLERDPDVIAALNFYAASPGAFDATQVSIAMAFAALGAAAYTRAAVQSKVDNLTIALDNSREIGVAMGVIMAGHKVTRDQAFDLLRIVSQRTHRKVADLAAEVAETGALPSF